MGICSSKLNTTAIIAFNSARKVEGSQILYMTSPTPKLQDFQPRESPKPGNCTSEPIEFDEEERPSGKDAGDVFLGLLRAERTNSSDDDLYRCLAVMSSIESIFFRASMGKFFDLWEKMTVVNEMAIKFRATWR